MLRKLDYQLVERIATFLEKDERLKVLGENIACAARVLLEFRDKQPQFEEMGAWDTAVTARDAPDGVSEAMIEAAAHRLAYVRHELKQWHRTDQDGADYRDAMRDQAHTVLDAALAVRGKEPKR